MNVLGKAYQTAISDSRWRIQCIEGTLAAFAEKEARYGLTPEDRKRRATFRGTLTRARRDLAALETEAAQAAS